MELQLYLDILKRRAWVIIIVAALVMAVVTSAGLVIPPKYEAKVTMRVLVDVGVANLSMSNTYAERLMNTYGRVLTSGPLLAETIDRLSPETSSLTVSVLRKEMVQIEVIPDTELITVAVQDRDPVLAQDIANMLATLLIEYAQDFYVGSSQSTRQILELQLADMEVEIEDDRQRLAAMLAEGQTGAEVETLSRQIELKEDTYNSLLDSYETARLGGSLRANNITIVEPASLPRVPINGFGLTEAGISLAVGISGGIGLALVLENLDTRIHSPQQLERLTHMPVLGTISLGLLPWNSPEYVDGTGNHSIEEAYRLLATNLQSLRREAVLQTILITSAMPKEGKSTVALNLAQVLAERGQTVFLVGSDLRRPSIARLLDIEDDRPGLSNLLVEHASPSPESLGQAMYPARQPSLFVIPGGPKVANPTALLASPSMESLLHYLAAQGQTTLLDAPPVLGTADVSVLTSRVDGVVLVVRQSQTRREQLLAAIKQLDASHARVIGIVCLARGTRGWDYG